MATSTQAGVSRSRLSLFVDQKLPRSTAAGGETRKLPVIPDLPDLRDRVYEPTLSDLKREWQPPRGTSHILDQGQEGACTGFGLASIINLLNARRATQQHSSGIVLPERVSPRMLYEMARLHDDLPDEIEGSTLRGALKGLFHNGVCSDRTAPYKASQKNWTLSVEMSKEARTVGLGAYYRLRPDIIDYHAAINEVGAIYCGTRTHDGWRAPKGGRIKPSAQLGGGHAFAIVGYTDAGFIVQNSWGPAWGDGGFALWAYEDWADNVMDAWVLQLSVPTPRAFDLTNRPFATPVSAKGQTRAPAPRRNEIIGHFANIDDGVLQASGTYATPLESIAETGDFLALDAQAGPQRSYHHIMIYGHGGLNKPDAEARRIAGMKEVFKSNGIYPFHLMWGTGGLEELADALTGKGRALDERMGGITDYTDAFLEMTTRPVGRAIWNQIKLDADRAAEAKGGGTAALEALFAPLLKLPASLRPKVHLVCHSAGSILLGALLDGFAKRPGLAVPLASASLMAPACTVDFFERHYRPLLKGNGVGAIEALTIYNLNDQRELDDSVAGAYRKSLLYLVSNAFETDRKVPLLGMELFSSKLKLPARATLHYAGAAKAPTNSTTHGGFDNDEATMNDVLKTILGRAPAPGKRFRQEQMQDY